jgi:hypothetical protein
MKVLTFILRCNYIQMESIRIIVDYPRKPRNEKAVRQNIDRKIH